MHIREYMHHDIYTGVTVHINNREIIIKIQTYNE